MANGILPEDVVCPTGFSVMVKLTTNSPVCIKSSTVARLIERNWGKNTAESNGKVILSMPYMTNVPNSNFTVNYAITGAIVTGLIGSPGLIISLQTYRDGSLTIKLPQKLLEDKITNHNLAHFIVLLDGQETDFRDIKTTPTYRIIQIPFTQGDTQIELVEAIPA